MNKNDDKLIFEKGFWLGAACTIAAEVIMYALVITMLGERFLK